MTLDEIRNALQGLKLADVAYESGLHYNTVRRIARGVLTNPKLETVNALSSYLQNKSGRA